MSHTSFHMFIGCYGVEEEENIHLVHFDGEKQTLKNIASYKGVENPSFLTVNRDHDMLYVISEVETGEVISYKINTGTRELRRTSSSLTKGSPCYVELGYEDRFLFTANYGNGSVIVHQLEQAGNIEKELAYNTHIEKEREKRSQIHTIRRLKDSNFYLATDIGLDKLYVYTFDEQRESFTFRREFQLPNGSGPRHLAAHPDKNVFYIVNEYHSTVLTYHYDDALQNIRLTQVLPTIPVDFKGDSYGADIHVTPSGNHLYLSNRGHNSVTGYETLENGDLKWIEHMSTNGEGPRQFAILPDGKHLLVANEHTNDVTIMAIATDGKLTPIGTPFKVAKPVCIHVLI